MSKLTLMIPVVAAVVLAGCNMNTTSTASPTPSAAPVENTMPAGDAAGTSEMTLHDGTTMQHSTDGSIVMAEEGQAVKVTSSNFKYDVKEIRAQQGQKLTVSFTNQEGQHDFVIDDLKVDSGVLPVGQTKELTIPTDKPGTYEFYCSVGQHRQMGMVGKVVIE